MHTKVDNIRRWGQAVIVPRLRHAGPVEGACYTPGQLRGYYVDLTQQVVQRPLLPGELPRTRARRGQPRQIRTDEVLTYGLGAYDLYLLERASGRLQATLTCAQHMLSIQDEYGGFPVRRGKAPYSARTQGQAVSLLLRAAEATGRDVYRDAARVAADRMLAPLSQGGTMSSRAVLCEHPGQPPVLSGWIFALWGAYDMCLAGESGDTRADMERSLASLREALPSFHAGYFSRSEINGSVASAACHDLHTAQLTASARLFDDGVLAGYAETFRRLGRNPVSRTRATATRALERLRK